jgi:hypothetical protein
MDHVTVALHQPQEALSMCGLTGDALLGEAAANFGILRRLKINCCLYFATDYPYLRRRCTPEWEEDSKSFYNEALADRTRSH